MNLIQEILIQNNLITAFVVVGLIVYLSYYLSEKFTNGRFHGSAIAIILGLIFAYIAGVFTNGEKGVSDIAILSGVGLLGGSMLRDFAIVATAYGAKFSDLRSSGFVGIFSLFFGVVLSFTLGALIAIAFGYEDPKSITTIGAGTVTCNYDGKNKHRTNIKDNVFIGSNSSLVAPITIDSNSIIGAGSVVTNDIPKNSLVIERSPLKIIKNYKKRLKK